MFAGIFVTLRFCHISQQTTSKYTHSINKTTSNSSEINKPNHQLLGIVVASRSELFSLEYTGINFLSNRNISASIFSFARFVSIWMFFFRWENTKSKCPKDVKKIVLCYSVQIDRDRWTFELLWKSQCSAFFCRHWLCIICTQCSVFQIDSMNWPKKKCAKQANGR